MARGSVFRRSGGWAFRVDTGDDPSTGRRRQTLRQGFTTKKQAEAALREMQQAADSNLVVARSTVRLGDYLDEWHAAQKLLLRATTWAGYGKSVRYIKDRLGRVPLQSLTTLQIEAVYATLLENGRRNGAGLSPKTVKHTHTVLRKALADAERLGLIVRNPAATARAPSVPRHEFGTWSSDELREFFAAVADDRMHALFVLLATTGMRRGEVLGLRWKDIDFDARQLAVVQTLTTVANKPHLGPTKTPRSRRTIYLDASTVEILRGHRRSQRAERLAAGPAWDGTHDLVFRDSIGRPYGPANVSRRFAILSDDAGLPRIRLHDLRHTYATLALKTGIHPKVVSERLGHATVGITLDLYSHVTPAIARDAADAVAATIFNV